jgi:polyisoprenoid-binding protein YceI
MTWASTSAPTTKDYAGTWNLDVAATTIEFHTKAMWVIKVKGTLKALRGTGTVGADGTVQGSVVMDATSVDTKINKRDAHLRTGDFLDTAHYPTVDFEATSGRLLESGKAELSGLLTVRGQTRPVVVVGDVGSDETSLTLTAEIDDLDRRDWGISTAAIGPSAHNRIIIRARFTKC